MLGVGVSCLTLDSAVEEVSGLGRPRRAPVRVRHRRARRDGTQRDPQLLRIHNRPGLTTPDGMPMVWSARWAGRREVSRVYGPDLMLAVLARAIRTRLVVLFYGGGPAIAERLGGPADHLVPWAAGRRTSTPPFRPLTLQEDAEIVQVINDSGAQLVGRPEHDPSRSAGWPSTARLRANALFGVGAAFDLVAGNAPQAPRWMQRSGLE